MSNWANLVPNYYRGRRVLVTGHTGFKGAWLCAWLGRMGAEVLGYSKDVPTVPSAFELLELNSALQNVTGDIRNRELFAHTLEEFKPDCVFHLAAQSLVRASYQDPLETFSTNVLGTASVLDALRTHARPVVFINVTSDKCYENRDWEFGYRETDSLGGADPYSASKGCAEIVFSAYARSFFAKTNVLAASVRAGNVIGGGDFAADRLVPDCVRAWSKETQVFLRNPLAIRPWQHVLEPLGGYLLLGAHLGSKAPKVAQTLRGEAFNFGPSFEAFQPVVRLVEGLQRHFPSGRIEVLSEAEQAQQPHEARTLKLSIDKAADVLSWRPTLTFSECIDWTAAWYQAALHEPQTLGELTHSQIDTFVRRLEA